MRAWILFCLLLPGIPLVAGASEPTDAIHVREIDALDQATLDKAEGLFFKGLAHYRAGQFKDAGASFQKAYELTKHRDLLFNLARTQEKLGDKKGAIEFYRSYLATSPADETAIVHRIRQLGGTPKPKADPVPHKPAPDLKAGDGSITSPELESSTQVEEGPGVWPWLALGTGVAAAGAGVWFGLQALDDDSKTRDAVLRADKESFAEDAKEHALYADISYGVGAVAIGTAIALWLWSDGNADGHVLLNTYPGGGYVGFVTSF